MIRRWVMMLFCGTSIGMGAGACQSARIQPLAGNTTASALPVYALPEGQRQVTFRWELTEGEMIVRGDGVARIAPPDTVRVDLFLAGGFGSASVIMIGDSLTTPPKTSMAELIPPPPLLWAALGRLAVPGVNDTTLQIAGDTVRADLGHPVRWRIEGVGGMLCRVERIENNRITESVVRRNDQIEYTLANRRSLQLTVQNDSPAAFDATIWTY